mgnify:CR=1 FL=1
MRWSLVVLSVLCPLVAHAGDKALTLGELAVGAASSKGSDVTVRAAYAGDRGGDKDCKGKATALVLVPPNGPDGAPESKLSTRVVACTDAPTAETAETTTFGSLLLMTGTVRVKKQSGMVVAVYLDGAGLK